ncbi:MAG: hypothetical protein DA328_08000 [Nitrososphaeraceae archaeon]|nr:hypothetical protein [Nitrososphaeraceae archaeon]
MKHSYSKIQSVIIGTSNNTWNIINPEFKEKCKQQLIVRDGNICNMKYNNGCGKELQDSFLQIDHIIPISLGGNIMDLSNMQLLCNKCHKRKTIRKDNKAIENRFKIKKSFLS